jgi:uncharacterized protein with FMN-binding domain
MRTSNAKALAAIALTAVGSAFVLGFKTADDLGIDTTALGTDDTASTSTTGTSGTADSSGTSGTTGSTGTTDATGDAAASAAYADGTWTGVSVSEPWGDFQVEIVVSGGTITDVSVVDSPSDRRSSNINSEAVPILTAETLQSQDASVDFVSGATWTSDSYTTSLQAALDEATQAA